MISSNTVTRRHRSQPKMTDENAPITASGWMVESTGRYCHADTVAWIAADYKK